MIKKNFSTRFMTPVSDKDIKIKSMAVPIRKEEKNLWKNSGKDTSIIHTKDTCI